MIKQYGQPEYCKISTVGYELTILKGLSKPIPSVSLTFNLPYHIDRAIECIHLLNKLGKYEYNYIYSSILNGFYEKKWLTAEEVIKRIEGMHNITFSKYIEIYARLL